MAGIRDWWKYAYGFAAGASVVALVLWGREGFVRMVERWRGVVDMSSVAFRTLRAEKKEVETAGAEEPIETIPMILRPKKPFEFRERLWHEPPEGRELNHDFASYEYFDVVQKEFKKLGGKDLEWKTAWLDLHIERALIRDYLIWVRKVKEEQAFGKNRAFYCELEKDIVTELEDVRAEGLANRNLYGKTQTDEQDAWNVMAKVVQREARKKQGLAGN